MTGSGPRCLRLDRSRGLNNQPAGIFRLFRRWSGRGVRALRGLFAAITAAASGDDREDGYEQGHLCMPDHRWRVSSASHAGPSGGLSCERERGTWAALPLRNPTRIGSI
ncbi:MAG: hypothetical protein ACOX6M_17145 [Armatimonadota bacterium]